MSAKWILVAALSPLACASAPLSQRVQDDIEARMHEARAKIEGCYQSARDSAEHGHLVAEVEFAAEEMAPRAVDLVQSDLVPEVEECARRALEAVRLAESPHQRVTAVFPMVFAKRRVEIMLMPPTRPPAPERWKL